MSQLLSDEEITLIVRECAKGSAINRDGSTSHRIARAIESAVMAKLREQEPVAWMSPGKERLEFSRKDTVYGSHTLPLFRNPAPIPNSMTVLDISDDDGLRFVQRVLESDATESDKDTARELVIAIRTRVRKTAPIPEGWRCPVCNTDLKHEHAYNCMAAARSGGKH